MDAELEFAIQPNTIGKQLFDQVSGTTVYAQMTTSDWFPNTSCMQKSLNIYA